MVSVDRDQLRVVERLSAGDNVYVDAVAGAGKTATILAALQQQSAHRRSLVLMYNKNLQVETARQHSGPGVAMITTIHAAVGAAYDRRGHVRDDDTLRAVLADPSLRLHVDYTTLDLIVVDEAQDLRQFHVNFIRRLVCANPRAQLMILGCSRQVLYRFYRVSPADERYLELCPRIFDNGRPWVRIPLHRSYRLTPSMARYVNLHWRDAQVCSAQAEGSDCLPVTHIVAHAWDDCVLRAIVTRCRTYGGANVVVIAHTTRGLERLATSIHRKTGIPVFIKDSDTHAERDDKLMSGKLNFMTFCATKGLGFPCVVAFVSDRFRPSSMQSTHDTNVALTRASHELVVVQSPKWGVVTGEQTGLTAEVLAARLGPAVAIVREPSAWVPPTVAGQLNFETSSLSVTALCHRLEMEQTLLALMQVEPEPNTDDGAIESDGIVPGRTHGTYEDVSSIIGTALPFIHAEQTGRRFIELIDWPPNPACKLEPSALRRYRDVLAGVDVSTRQPADCAFLTFPKRSDAPHRARYERLLHRVQRLVELPVGDLEFLMVCEKVKHDGRRYVLEQLHPGAAWLTPPLIERGTRRLHALGLCRHETVVACSQQWIHGRVDGFDSTCRPVELKFCKGDLTANHRIQAALYLCLLPEAPSILLYNYRTGERLRITCGARAEFLAKAVDLKHRRAAPTLTDDAFVALTTDPARIDL